MSSVFGDCWWWLWDQEHNKLELEEEARGKPHLEMRRETRGVVLVFWIKSSSLNLLHHTTDKSTGWATTKAWCAWQSAHHTASYPLTLALTQPSSISSQAKSRRICAWCRCTCTGCLQALESLEANVRYFMNPYTGIRESQILMTAPQGKDKMGGCQRTRAATITVSNASSFAKRRASWLSYMFGAVLSIHIGAFSFARGFSWGWPWTTMKCCEQRAQYLLGHQISQHSDALHTYDELSWSTLSSLRSSEVASAESQKDALRSAVVSPDPFQKYSNESPTISAPALGLALAPERLQFIGLELRSRPTSV